ncbi:unnamed protein product [Adineta ricciae]|uniref:Uncharacterized protein n=1 Tax=Adineta ricciae TaxID=249248 RepID=A0A815W9P2_ADIRI|nr:unnamed protein product [Adineta ricciae]
MLRVVISALILSMVFIVVALPPENHLELIMINNSTVTLTYENTQTSPSTTVSISTDVIRPRSNMTIIAYFDPTQHGDVFVVIHFKCDTQQVALIIDDRVQVHMGQSIFQIAPNELIVSSDTRDQSARIPLNYLHFDLF